MTRTEAIAIIAEHLASLDDEHVLAVAEIVSDIAAPSELPRPLTAGELAALGRSKEDFRAGRTLSLAEARERTDTFLARARALRIKA